jgi:hypothetical protein
VVDDGAPTSDVYRYASQRVELADTSAWVWSRAVGGPLRAAFDEAIVEGDDRIAAITGQDVRWLTPRGSLR